MPTYDFRCPNGHTFERFLRMSDAPMVLPCPECGTEAERRISGGAGLSFKGSGFYLTDYGKNAHRAPGGETKSGGSEKGGGGENAGGGEKGGGESSGADSKPAKGSESKSEVRTEKSESKPAAPAPESKPSKPSSSE